MAHRRASLIGACLALAALLLAGLGAWLSDPSGRAGAAFAQVVGAAADLGSDDDALREGRRAPREGALVASAWLDDDPDGASPEADEAASPLVRSRRGAFAAFVRAIPPRAAHLSRGPPQA